MDVAAITAPQVVAPAAVVVKVKVAWPDPSVVPGELENVPPFVDVGVTDAPWIGFPPASFAVTVTVVPASPAVIVVGKALIWEVAALTPPGVTVSVGCCARVTAPTIAVTVFTPVWVEETVYVACPAPFVVWVRDGVIAFPLPVTPSVTDCPPRGL